MRFFTALFVAGLFFVCGGTSLPAGENELTPKEKEQGWQLLFNGRDHTGWKCNNGQAVATPIEEGGRWCRTRPVPT